MKPKSAGNRHKRRRPGLTVGEAKKAVAKIAQGQSKEKVMVETLGYAPTTARSHPESLDRDPNFQKQRTLLQSALIAQNPAIFEKLALRVNEGLDAKKQVAALLIKGKRGDVIDPAAPEATASTQDFIEVDDHQTRLRFCEFIAKAFNQFRDIEAPSNANVLNISVFFQLVQQAEKERGLE